MSVRFSILALGELASNKMSVPITGDFCVGSSKKLNSLRRAVFQAG